MSGPLAEIHAHLRAADRALALARGGSSELAHVREAAGALLVAVHELVRLWEKREPAAGGPDAAGSSQAPAPARRSRR